MTITPDDFPIRKIATIVEEIRHDGGPPAAVPRRRAAALVLVKNPFAGAYHADLQPAMDALKPLGLEMTKRLIAALGGIDGVDGYGKGSLVGSAGELEHGALWHVPGGYAMRDALGEALAIVPSSKKVGGMGASLDIPIGHKDAAYVRSHFDSMEVHFPDGPKPDEILFALVMTCGPRVQNRMGGLEADKISLRDGQR
ncbi:MAG: amino acid synthesis family protein [Hoeflea sp.]|uniref:amino acid synthesis family protein n=1 Tax=Hoeflea sp. TaxID=1940281 RepID=UPI0032977661|tara:strand:+ start:19164 stop:19757 length:594 start_codon:yes stop_codon:yes gene_type:complete